MNISFHKHALNRMKERGVLKKEVISAIKTGEKFSAKYNRTVFRQNFVFGKKWLGKLYNTKQIEVYAVNENNNWFVITVIAKYF
ncbi:MAG: DUF4258 domain-containing protein [Candidatus Cloacimonadota bacterium]|nr:DUF4258 domain-containing protein [Candidatus Cloacimonadota bacterium]